MRLHHVLLLVLAGIVCGTPRPSAHHAFAAEFDSTRPIKLRGTVVKMEWINPAHLAAPRREAAGWQDGTLDDRGRPAERTVSARLQQELPAGRC
jgi:hypothetical protein